MSEIRTERLKGEAQRYARFRGHILSPWTHREHQTIAYTSCERCGLGVYVTAKPAANEAPIMGQAVATNCQEPTRGGEST
jgi:hypothetical protein